jgi:hypothetical protein
MRRAVQQRDYEPVFEDWAWHAAIPTLAYASWIYGGLQLERGRVDAPYFVGGAALLLLFVGIHNAWDTVVYVIVERTRQRGTEQAAQSPNAAGGMGEDEAQGDEVPPV